MGCGSCSTAETGTPNGCQSNGTCGTSGCNKLNVYNWLADMVLPEGHKPFDIVEVRFKGSRKEFYRNVNNLDLKTGDMVAVEGNPGHDIGEVSLAGELVRFQLRKKNVKEDSSDIRLLYRVAKSNDIEKWREVKDLEHRTMHRSRTIAMALGLKMKLSDVEFQGDGKKATFFYTADERVDFRELIKKLADEFRVRIEMRQIGMRQEAARLGGIGSCGRELCCSTWLTDFKVVSTSAARYQNLSLNPLKLAGQCGKLKCCLNYELDTYLDALKDIPETNIKLLTAKGTLHHRKTDIFRRIMWYVLFPDVKDGEDRPFMGAENWIPMSVDRVKEIIALNNQNIRPEETGGIVAEEKELDLEYQDVVGQDSLTRMDRQKKKKKKKKPADKTMSGPVSDKPQQARPAGPQPRPQNPNQQKQNQNQNQNKREGQKEQRRPQPNEGQRKQEGGRPDPQQRNDNRNQNRPPRQEPPKGNANVQQPAQQQQQPVQQQPQQQPRKDNRPPRIPVNPNNNKPGTDPGNT